MVRVKGAGAAAGIVVVEGVMFEDIFETFEEEGVWVRVGFTDEATLAAPPLPIFNLRIVRTGGGAAGAAVAVAVALAVAGCCCLGDDGAVLAGVAEEEAALFVSRKLSVMTGSGRGRGRLTLEVVVISRVFLLLFLLFLLLLVQ